MRILKLRQVEVVTLIYHQILLTNLQGNELKRELIIRSWGVWSIVFIGPQFDLLTPLQTKPVQKFGMWYLFPSITIVPDSSFCKPFHPQRSHQLSSLLSIYNVSLENLILDQLKIPYLIFFLYSHHLSACHCIDIVRRNSLLITHGSQRVKEQNCLHFVINLNLIFLFSLDSFLSILSITFFQSCGWSSAG